MIEKLERHTRVEKGLTQDIKISCPPEQPEIVSKINELVDAVNDIQKEREAERFEIQEWIGIIESVRKSVNAHKKQIGDLQNRITAFDDPTYHEEPAENGKCSKMEKGPYAEQRKWIGKLCKFRDNYEDKWHFGVLEEIYEHSDFPFGDFDNFEWAICEPVKPDDDIIYKGE